MESVQIADEDMGRERKIIEDYIDLFIQIEGFNGQKEGISMTERNEKGDLEGKADMDSEFERIGRKVLEKSLKTDGKETFYLLFLERGIKYAKEGNVKEAIRMFENAMRKRHQLCVHGYRAPQLVDVSAMDANVIDAINLAAIKFTHDNHTDYK